MEKTTKKGIINLFVCIVILAIGSILAGIIVNTDFGSSSNRYKNYNYRLTSYSITIDVSEDRTCTIEEKIDAEFDVMAAGITRYIPIKNDIYRQDGSKEEVFVEVKNFQIVNNGRAENRVYDKYSDNLYYVVELGYDTKKSQSTHSYDFKYDYVLGPDTLSNYDEFYFNVVGTAWDCEINNVEFVINLPKNFEYDLSSNVGATCGEYGSDTPLVPRGTLSATTIDGKTSIMGSISYLDAFEGVTVRATLPNNFFVNEVKTDYSFLNILILIIVVIGIVLLAWYIWKKYGKDEELVAPVGFYPPRNMNPLDIEYYYNTTNSTKGITGLMVYLADKGYIKIEQLDEKGKTFKLIKVKDYVGTNLVEKNFMNALFKNSTEVLSKDMSENLYSYTSNTLRKANTPSRANKLFDSINNKGFKIMFNIVLIFAVLFMARLEFALSFTNKFVNVLTIGFILLIIMTVYWSVVKVNQNRVKIKFVPVYVLTSLLTVFQIVYFFVKKTSVTLYAWHFVYVFIGLLGMILCAMFINFMDRRTDEYSKLLGEIQGFRDFIEFAEKEKLEELVKEDPQYFYNILPYAYVLGVSDKWIKHLNYIHIEEPNWYVGSGTGDLYTQMFVLNSSMNSINNSITNNMMQHGLSSIGKSISSGGSSGGFSGGGFSGGGFGGGGGGMR